MFFLLSSCSTVFLHNKRVFTTLLKSHWKPDYLLRRFHKWVDVKSRATTRGVGRVVLSRWLLLKLKSRGYKITSRLITAKCQQSKIMCAVYIFTIHDGGLTMYILTCKNVKHNRKREVRNTKNKRHWNNHWNYIKAAFFLHLFQTSDWLIYTWRFAFNKRLLLILNSSDRLYINVSHFYSSRVLENKNAFFGLK